MSCLLLSYVRLVTCKTVSKTTDDTSPTPIYTQVRQCMRLAMDGRLARAMDAKRDTGHANTDNNEIVAPHSSIDNIHTLLLSPSTCLLSILFTSRCTAPTPNHSSSTVRLQPAPICRHKNPTYRGKESSKATFTSFHGTLISHTRRCHR